jgi:hypothetical protein
MSDKIREKVLESVRIAKECPDNLQEKCFEVVLLHYLSQLESKPEKKHAVMPEETQLPPTDGPAPAERKGSGQKDIADRDLHVKVKQFLKRAGLTADHVNQIFYKEGDEIKPLYDDLKTTGIAESQIRIALLHALRNAISAGGFQFDGEEVRKETQLRKCYDPTNFATTFRNNKALFDNFDGYDKSQPRITLSTQGKDKLAEIIKDLQ